MKHEDIIEEIPGLYRMIALRVMRRTPGVSFDYIAHKLLPRVDAVDRVIHVAGAVSPGPVGDVARPWYWHPHQADNLLVMHGRRYVDLYSPGAGRMLSFVVEPQRIECEGRVIVDGPAMLVWPVHVFHRVVSDPLVGSASVNLATRGEGYDPRTNFNIYDVDLATGASRLLREGWKDQPDDTGRQESAT